MTTLFSEMAGDGMILPPDFLAPPGERTFQYQDQLPSLPVPDLRHTLDVYLQSVKPFVTENEYANTKRIVEEFGCGVGKDLHSKLLERAEDKRNWLEEWWEKYAYLTTRTAHPPHLVMSTFGLPSEIFRSSDRTETAAMAAWYVVKYWELVRREQLRVDKGGGKTTWCMVQNRRFFNDCKSPGDGMCQLNHYLQTDREGGDCPHHLAVLYRGRLFSFDVLDHQGAVITAPEIQSQIQHIVDVTQGMERGPGVGALTAAPRDPWKGLWDHLITIHPDNEKALEVVKRSITVLSLDDSSPTSPEQEIKNLLFGDPGSRWFDKTLGMVAFQNGKIGFWIDHCPVDAMIMVSIGQFMAAASAANRATWQGSQQIRPMVKPKEHRFHVDDVLVKCIQEAKEDYCKVGENSRYITRTSRKHGADRVKSHGVHPDIFVQLALQLAYFRLHHRPAPTYETATTRAFHHARTETVRSCTVEAYDWCKAMLNRKENSRKKSKLFMEAYSKHKRLMGKAMKAQGCDRHLLGLQITAAEQGLPTPELYTDPAYTKSGGGGNFILSTSYLGASHMNGIIVPMCKEGYTVLYAINSNKITFSCSTWEDDDTHPEELLELVLDCMDQVLDLLQSSYSEAESSSKL